MVDQERHRGREAFAEFMDEFMNESDRACIILASAEMEARFELLFSKFLKANAKLREHLFSFTGPLGSFSARVKMAYGGGPRVKATLYTLLIRRDEDGRGAGLLSWYFGLTKYGYWCSGIVSTPMRARIHNK